MAQVFAIFLLWLCDIRLALVRPEMVTAALELSSHGAPCIRQKQQECLVHFWSYRNSYSRYNEGKKERLSLVHLGYNLYIRIIFGILIQKSVFRKGQKNVSLLQDMVYSSKQGKF